MAETTTLIITLRVPVADVPAGEAILNQVQDALSVFPEMKATGQVTTKFIEEAEAPEQPNSNKSAPTS